MVVAYGFAVGEHTYQLRGGPVTLMPSEIALVHMGVGYIASQGEQLVLGISTGYDCQYGYVYKLELTYLMVDNGDLCDKLLMLLLGVTVLVRGCLF